MASPKHRWLYPSAIVSSYWWIWLTESEKKIIQFGSGKNDIMNMLYSVWLLQGNTFYLSANRTVNANKIKPVVVPLFGSQPSTKEVSVWALCYVSDLFEFCSSFTKEPLLHLSYNIFNCLDPIFRTENKCAIFCCFVRSLQIYCEALRRTPRPLEKSDTLHVNEVAPSWSNMIRMRHIWVLLPVII